MAEDNQAVEEKGRGPNGGSRWRELYQTEDYWAIWLGLAIIVIGLVVFLPRPPEAMEQTIRESNATMAKEVEAAPFRTIAWYKAGDAKEKLKATSGELAGTIKKYTGKPHGWKTNPVEAFVVTEARAAQKKARAQEKYDAVKGEADSLESEARAAEQAARETDFKDDALNKGLRLRSKHGAKPNAPSLRPPKNSRRPNPSTRWAT